MFLEQHGIYPPVYIGGYHLDRPIEVIAGKPFTLENLPHLLPLTLRNQCNMKVFIGPRLCLAFKLGTYPEKVSHSHAEAIGEEICKT
jgi:hypothetical protein